MPPVRDTSFCHRHADSWRGIDVDIVRAFATVIGRQLKFCRRSTTHFESVFCELKGNDAGGCHPDIAIGGFLAYDDPVYVATEVKYATERVVIAELKNMASKNADVVIWCNHGTDVSLELISDLFPGAVLVHDEKRPRTATHAALAESEVEFGSFGRGEIGAVVATKMFAQKCMYVRTQSSVQAELSAFLTRIRLDGTLSKIILSHGSSVRTLADTIGSLTLKTPGTLVVGGDTFAPVFDADSKTGIDVEIMKGFAKVMGLRVVFKRVPVRELVSDTVSSPLPKGCDVIMGGVSDDYERRSFVRQLTTPYTFVRRSIIVRKGHPLKGVENGRDFKGRLYARKGSSAWSDGMGAANIVSDAGKPESQVFRELLDGKVDGVMRGSLVADALKARHPKLFDSIEWDRSSQSKEGLHAMVDVSSGLVTALSGYFEMLKSTGKIAEIIAGASKLMKVDGVTKP